MMRQSVWYKVEIPLFPPLITTVNRGTLTSGASRGQCKPPGGGSPCMMWYSYPLLAPVSIAPFTSLSRAATSATHAITRLACPPEVKSRSRGKFTRARISHFPLFAVTYPLISRQRDIIRCSYIFSMLMRITICGRAYSWRYIKIYLLNRSRHFCLFKMFICSSLFFSTFISLSKNCCNRITVKAVSVCTWISWKSLLLAIHLV